MTSLKSSCLFSKSNLADPCLPEVEALVHAKEQLEIDTSFANADVSFGHDFDFHFLIPLPKIIIANNNNFQTNVDDDDPCDLIESRSEVTAEGCNESPVPNKSLAPGLGNEEISSEEQKCAKQDDPCNLIDSTSEVTAEGFNESPVPNKNLVPDLANGQECDDQIDPTPSPEQAEVSLINNRLSNIQTKSGVSRRFPDSEKQERSIVTSDLHIVFSCRVTHSLSQSQFSLFLLQTQKTVASLIQIAS